MKFEEVVFERSEILGRKSPATAPIGASDVDRWRRSLGYLSVFAGMAAIVSSQSTNAYADKTDFPKAERIPARVAALAKKISGACSKPELLRRQSEYRLPGQKGEFNMMTVLAGGDNCPGNAIPAGTYTAAAPFSDKGTTVGANDTVTAAFKGTGGCIDGFEGPEVYAQVEGPDHIYSFTLTARGANPRITVDGGGTYDTAVYILSNTGDACPAGTANEVSNCLMGRDVNFSGAAEVLDAAKINALPLNVPLYLFIDSFYDGPTSTTVNQGPYTITIQDVTIGGGPTLPDNDAPVDMNGDGRSDYVVVRNAGGPSGQFTWYTMFQGGFPANGTSAPTRPTDWGVATDTPIPADFDGDGKDDFAVWRPGTQGVFYIVRSATSTMFSEPFGQTGDDPTVVGDYTGDDRDDLAVYRSGATAADQSFWFYRSIGSPPGFERIPWGQGGDFPAPGDYDGDNKYDFVIQRTDFNGVNGRFWVREADGLQYSQWFGLATDSVVPGDYDGDGKTDLAVARNDNGQIRWDFEPSGTAGVAVVTDTWGVALTDFITQGDYNGDGKTDYAIWRPGSPGQFYVMTVGDRVISIQPWGQTGDYPAANYNEH